VAAEAQTPPAAGARAASAPARRYEALLLDAPPDTAACGPLVQEARVEGLHVLRGAEADQPLQLGIHPSQRLDLRGATTATVEQALVDQIARRRRGELPVAPDDPEWSVVVEGVSSAAERVHESLLTVADGCIGTRGSLVCPVPGGAPSVVAAGVYHGTGPESELLELPRWNEFREPPPSDARVRRVLDLRAGVLHQEIDAGRRVRACLFTSMARPGIAVARALAEPQLQDVFGPPLAGPDVEVRAAAALEHASAAAAGEPGGVAIAASQRRSSSGWLERIAAYRPGTRRRPAPATAAAALRAAERAGSEQLLNEHRAAMAARWAEAGVAIGGDPELDRAVRFCLFHLMTSVGEGSEAAVGARGLSGAAYRGHVFWDADVYVLPFLAATHPRAARAMLDYRRHRLAAPRAEAAGEGRRGAHLPWESAATGEEVTPTRGRDRLGRFVPIRTGQLEEHIVSDVAWAASCYAAWSGDERYLRGPGGDLLLETARWWADRIGVDPAGRAHIRGVIGPDEYHQPVDDDAYTNVMARWHLRRAARLAGDCGRAEPWEPDHWLRLATALVDGYDPVTRVYEQYAGFNRLEPLVIADLAPQRPVAATLLLGDERVAGAQVVKQADVLLLHHLVREETAPGSLEANLAFYEPRTAHGSSLSPGVHAALLARTGRVDEARDLLAVTASLDLDDRTGTTAGGLHLAAMGSVWQALAWGFAGLWPRGEVLEIAPRLPACWTSLELRLRYRGAQLRIAMAGGSIELSTDRPVAIAVEGCEPVRLGAGAHRLERSGSCG
jgi:trehalose/maltose hydrolase-like predicted phosphorylase